MYTAIVLDESQRQMLLRQLFKNYLYPLSGWVIKADHITINMGRLDEELNPDIALDERCTATVRDVLYRRYDGLFAVGVHEITNQNWKSINSINAHPHITIAHKQDVKPKAVNKYSDEREWQIIPKLNGLKVHGTLMEPLPSAIQWHPLDNGRHDFKL
jgi:hypothetical protein